MYGLVQRDSREGGRHMGGILLKLYWSIVYFHPYMWCGGYYTLVKKLLFHVASHVTMESNKKKGRGGRNGKIGGSIKNKV